MIADDGRSNYSPLTTTASRTGDSTAVASTGSDSSVDIAGYSRHGQCERRTLSPKGNGVMSRRTIVFALSAALIGVPFAVRAQSATGVRHVGFLDVGASPTPAELEEVLEPLRKLGWIEGRNLVFIVRSANGSAVLLRTFAEELVALKVDIIETNGTAAALAAKQATTSIPIVMFSAGDPVRTGLVASLARPGGNITGYAVVAQEVVSKMASLIRELLPQVQRVAVLLDPANPLSAISRKDGETLYRSLGMHPIFIEVTSADQLKDAVAQAARDRAQALIVQRTSLFTDNRATIMGAALRHLLPTVVGGQDELEAGALISYSISWDEQRQRVAAFIDRILRGAKPADLPVEQPTKFELGINMKTATVLGLVVPPSVRARAERVIQ